MSDSDSTVTLTPSSPIPLPPNPRTESSSSTSTTTTTSDYSSTSNEFDTFSPSCSSTTTSQIPITPLSELTLSDLASTSSTSNSPFPSPAAEILVERDDESTPTPDLYCQNPDESKPLSINSENASLTSASTPVPIITGPLSRSALDPLQPHLPDLDLDSKPPLQTSISAPPGSITTTSDLGISPTSPSLTAQTSHKPSMEEFSSGPKKGFSFGSCPSVPIPHTNLSSSDMAGHKLFLGTPTAEKGEFEYPSMSSSSSQASSSSRRGSLAYTSYQSSFFPPSSSRRSSIATHHHDYRHSLQSDFPRKPSLTRRSSSSASTITSLSSTTDFPTRRPSLHPITATPIHPLPFPTSPQSSIASSSRRGSLIFQPKALPAPIPPSLLARRGSLPATDKIFGLPIREKRTSGGTGISGSGGGLNDQSGSSPSRRSGPGSFGGSFGGRAGEEGNCALSRRVSTSSSSEMSTSASNFPINPNFSLRDPPSPRRSPVFFSQPLPTIANHEPPRRSSLRSSTTSFPESIQEVNPPAPDQDEKDTRQTHDGRRRSSVPFRPPRDGRSVVHSGQSKSEDEARISDGGISGQGIPSPAFYRHSHQSIPPNPNKDSANLASPISPRSARLSAPSTIHYNSTPQSDLASFPSGAAAPDPADSKYSSTSSSPTATTFSTSTFSRGSQTSSGRGSLLSRGSRSGLSSSEEEKEDEIEFQDGADRAADKGDNSIEDGLARQIFEIADVGVGEKTGKGMVFADPWATGKR